MKQNVTIEDIKTIERELGKELSEEQRGVVLAQFNRLVMDSADDWSVILHNLIIGICSQ